MTSTTVRIALAFAFSVVLAGTHATDAVAASRRKVCRVACHDEITACIEQGLGTTRQCKRGFIHRCRQEGVQICADPSAIRTGATWVLIAPDPVDAMSDAPTAAQVEWVDTNTQESGYMVERSSRPDGGFVEIAVTLADVTAIVDTGLAPDRTYYYRVRAYRDRGKKTLYSYYSSVHAAHTRSGGGTTTTSSTTSTTTMPTSTTSSTSTSATSTSSSTTSTVIGQNQLPVAHAGADKTAAPGDLLVFDGRGSYDPDGTIVQYYWNFGDGGVWGTTSVALRSYSAPGTYTVTLYVGDDSNAWTSDTLIVTVTAAGSTTTSSTSSTSTSTSTSTSSTTSTAPSTSTSSTSSSTSTSTVPSTSTSSTSSSTSTSTVPSTSSTSSTTSSSTSTTSTSSSTSTTSSTVPNQAPVAKAGPDMQGATGQSLVFDGAASYDTDGQIVAYAWTFGDGTNANGVVSNHAYSSSGTYTAVLWVQDDDGAWSSDSTVVTVADAGGSEWLGLETGGSSQQTTGVARAGAEDVIAGGFSNGPVTIGSTQLDGVLGRLDGYVAKYLQNGTPAWVHQLAAGAASGSMVIVEGVAGDAAGNAVAVGRFSGSMQAGSTTLASAGAQDAFVVRYAANGALTWARRFGGTLDDVAKAVAMDADGNVFVTGSYSGAVDFGGGTLEETKILPAPTLFVLKLSPNGSHAWSRSFRGTANEVGRGIAVAPSGDVVVGGTFDDRMDFGTGMVRTRGVGDGFVIQLTPTGAHRWSRQLGGTAADEVAAVATAADGTVAITGRFRGNADFGGGYLSATPTVSDAVIAAYSSSGAHRWSRSAGSAFAEDNGAGIGFDAAGNVFVTGAFMDSAEFGGPTPIVSRGGRDAFLLELAPNGTYRAVDTWGGTGNDEGLAAAAWGPGRVVTGGFFRGAAVIAGTSVTSTGSSDGFTACVAR